MRSSPIFPHWVHGYPEDQYQSPQNVPEPQHPKRRPPKTFRQKLPLIGALPQYSGPYEVGIIDLEIPVEKRTFSHLARKHIPLLALETVLISVYYPAEPDTPKHQSSRNSARPQWLLRPRQTTSKGYGRFASLPSWPTMGFFLLTTWSTKLRAYEYAELADHWPPNDEKGRDEARIHKRARGDPPQGQDAKPTFPLIIFSHGMGGSRLCYSAICGEFASHGFMVCAIEHRDGSGATSVVNHPPGQTTRHISHQQEYGKYHFVEFVFPQRDRYDTTPGHEIDAELRAAQIQMRLAELEEAYKVMVQIQAGRGLEVARNSIRRVGRLRSNSISPDAFDWSGWKGRFHIDDVTLVGHSFGGATVVEALRRQKTTFSYVSQGIVYDLWGMPLRDVDHIKEHQEHEMQVPLLCVGSEAFMYWPANFEVTRSICEEAIRSGARCWFLTVRGTVHISTSDWCILYPYLATTLMKTSMGATRAIDVNVDASLEFLATVLPTNEKPFHRFLPKHRLLELASVQDLPDEHVPKEKWTAIRLHTSHEARKRIFIGRKKLWQKLKMAGQEEVWLHLKPDDEASRAKREL